VGPGAPPNVSVPASKYLEHKWNLLVIKDAFVMPFFHYFWPIDGVFMFGFYSLSIINSVSGFSNVVASNWNSLIHCLALQYRETKAKRKPLL